MLLVLTIAALLGREPKPDEVRWILYVGCDRTGRGLTPGSPELEAQCQLWWVYHANHLCHIALETLLKFTLDTLGEHPAGITLARLIPLCVDRILESAEHPPVHWSAFLDSLQPAANAYAADEGTEWALCDAIISARAAATSGYAACPVKMGCAPDGCRNWSCLPGSAVDEFPRVGQLM
ncbi:hypothetical protein [Mesorhizobium sp. WSM2239]|uniref:Uncharacterized protein n=2 Tax=unclassified Mesorhizobium TaxID=325217 RepID=A0AAU8D743_9HYPH